MTKKQIDKFNSIQDENCGIVEPKPIGDKHGPKDIQEFLVCLKNSVDAIDKSKRNIAKARNDPNSTISERGASYMLEDTFRTDLYEIVKEYVHWYIQPNPSQQ